MTENGLAFIFGKPKSSMGKSEESSEDYGDIPPDFVDHCDAAFDALKSGKRERFCNELWLAIKAYEETPHEERDEGEHEGERHEENEEEGEEY